MIILAIILGIAFGFVLQRIGASNPHNIINMLRLTDFHLMKTILLGIAIASALLFFSNLLGWVDVTHLSVKVSHWGVIIGGIIFGVGWAVAGYCPGTGLAGLGEGRKDAIFFILGGLLGALFYMLVYGGIKDSFLFTEILGGKSTLATTANESYHVIIKGPNDVLYGTILYGTIVALSIALVLVFISTILPTPRPNNKK